MTKKVNRYPSVLPWLLSIFPNAIAEFKFHPQRRFSSDFAVPSEKLLIEIDGGVWSGGRHTRGQGFINDQEKTNEAAILGYYTLRFIPKDVFNGHIFTVLSRFLNRNEDRA